MDKKAMEFTYTQIIVMIILLIFLIWAIIWFTGLREKIIEILNNIFG